MGADCSWPSHTTHMTGVSLYVADSSTLAFEAHDVPRNFLISGSSACVSRGTKSILTRTLANFASHRRLAFEHLLGLRSGCTKPYGWSSHCGCGLTSPSSAASGKCSTKTKSHFHPGNCYQQMQPELPLHQTTIIEYNTSVQP